MLRNVCSTTYLNPGCASPLGSPSSSLRVRGSNPDPLADFGSRLQVCCRAIKAEHPGVYRFVLASFGMPGQRINPGKPLYFGAETLEPGGHLRVEALTQKRDKLEVK